jgi:hypothetical protein
MVGESVAASPYSTQRPTQVSTAVLLQGGSFVLGLVPPLLLHAQVSGAFLFAYVVTLALLAWITYKVWVGRNWARFILALLFAGGVIVNAPNLLQAYHQLPLLAASCDAIGSLLQVASLYLLFTDPGRRWFKARPPSPNNRWRGP